MQRTSSRSKYSLRIQQKGSHGPDDVLAIKTQIAVESSAFNLSDQYHDQALMNLAQTLEPTISKSLSNLRLNSKGSSGRFKRKIANSESHAVDPLILNSILRLSPMSVVSQNILAEYRLSTLASLTISTPSHPSSYEHFATRVKPSESGIVESDCEIRLSGKLVSLQDMRYQAAKVAHQAPLLNSLFFKPTLLPDITSLSTAEPMSISRCAVLLSRKWPSCDIKITGVPEELTVPTLEAFGTGNGGARSFFRSVKCSAKPLDVFSDRVQLVYDSEASNKYHMIFTQEILPEARLGDGLYPGGLVCIPKAYRQDLRLDQSPSLEVLCDITELDSNPWVLLRHTTALSPVCARRRAVMFTSHHIVYTLSIVSREWSLFLWNLVK